MIFKNCLLIIKIKVVNLSTQKLDFFRPIKEPPLFKNLYFKMTFKQPVIAVINIEFDIC